MSKAEQEEKASEVIKDYMLKQNRPYSAVDVTTNLHKEFGKTLVIKVLESLVDSKVLKEKILCKQKIFYPNQDNFPSFDEAELKNLDYEIQKASETVKQVIETRKRLETELKSLESALPNPELQKKLAELKADCERLGKKLEEVNSSGQKVDPNVKAQLEKRRDKLQGEWRKRKRMANEMLNSILENCPKKKKDLLEEIGIELDTEK